MKDSNLAPDGLFFPPRFARAFFWFGLLTLPAAAQDVAQDAVQDAATVTAVRFEGLASVTESYARSVVRIAPGDIYDAAVVKADVQHLLATGRFAAADSHAEPVDGGVEVVFVLRERLRVADIRFTGNQKFSDKKLLSKVPLQVGDPLDTFRVREGADIILSDYRDAGYGQASVTYDKQLMRSTGELLFTIEEGPQIRIHKVVFEGATSIPKRELNKQITSKTHLWIFRDGKFDEDAVEADAANLQNYYRKQGYLDARVSYRLAFGENQRDLSITFDIVEGTRYRIESIRFEGNTVLNDTELRSLILFTENDPILQERLDRAVKSIREYYGARGYIYARVRAVRVFSDQPDLVRIAFYIEEGEQYRVGRIVVRGNERTRDKVVRRALDLYPEDVLDLTKTQDAQRSLRQTQIFKSATVTPVGDQPDVRDLVINVEEARKAGDFLFGFGVTSNSGVVGSIVFDIRNFDIFDRPRSFEEFIKLRSFYGGGQRLRIEAQPGTQLTRFRLDFTEPFLMDKPLRFDFSAYYFERRRESYNERRVGSNVSLGKRLKSGFLEGWYGELALRVEGVKVDELDILPPRDVRDDEGATLLTSLKATFIRDRTDSRLLPTRGDRTRFAYEQFGVLGGDFFGKFTGSYAKHFTLKTDELERKSVLSFKGVGGFTLGETPVFERFYAGGIGSIRGFQFRGVSPRQGLDDDPIGGELMMLFSTEYSFPLYGELLRGLVFTDMGTVERDIELTNWRVAIGAGVRLQIDFFGPVPLEFAVATPLFSDEQDEEQVFSFFIGAAF